MTLSNDILQSFLRLFNTDEFYLWEVRSDPSTDSYTFHFQYNNSSEKIVVAATAEELASYNTPEYAMRRGLRWARDAGRLRLGAECRLSELIAALPSSERAHRAAAPAVGYPFPRYEDTNDPTEAMLEASYRV